MAVNNDFKYVGISGNSWYVSALYGDDLNTGSKTDPFKTKEKAEQSASNGDTIVLGTGFYNLTQGAIGANTYKYFGEGLVIFSEPLIPSLFFGPNVNRVENIIFLNWTNFEVIEHGAGKTTVFVNCKFIETLFSAGIDASFGHYIGCVFDKCDFSSGAIENPPTAGGIFNCDFFECTGSLPALEDYIDGIFNNNFILCQSLMVGIAIGQPIDKFNYNNIGCDVGGGCGINGLTVAEIQGLGFNSNGTYFSASTFYNDYLSSRTTAEYFKQDLTKKDSVQADAISIGSSTDSIIGRFNKGERFSASVISANSIDEDLVSLVGDALELDVFSSEGFMKSSFDLGAVKNINILNIFQEIDWNTITGNIERIADFFQDVTPDPSAFKASFDIEIQHKEDISDIYTTSVIEYDKYIIDRSPQMIKARYLIINLTLRDYTL